MDDDPPTAAGGGSYSTQHVRIKHGGQGEKLRGALAAGLQLKHRQAFAEGPAKDGTGGDSRLDEFDAGQGNQGGGSLIGQLERALIFAFVLVGYLEGIGFLVAAKSILRFKNTEEQKMAEYVLIGTLMSFALAIALASATKWAMGL